MPQLPATTAPREQPGSGTRPTGWALATGLFLALALAAPLVFAAPRPESFAHLPVVLAAAITLYSAGRLWLLLMTGANRPVSLTFWLFVYIFFGLAALYNTVSQRFALLYQTFSESTQTAALLAIIVGLAGFELGRLLGRDRATQSAGSLLLNRLSVRPRRILIIGGIGALAVAYFTVKYGLAVRFSSRETATQTFFGGSESSTRLFLRTDKAAGLLRLTLDWLPGFVAFFLLLAYRRTRLAERRGNGMARSELWMRLMLFVLAITVLLNSNPLSNPRARFLGVALALLLAVWPLVTPRRFRVFALLVTVGMLFIYPYADYFRNDQRGAQSGPASGLLAGPDFSMFQQEANAQVYVSQHGHTWGRQALGVVFGWVPKSMWKEKPQSTGALVFPQAAQTLPTSLSLWGFAVVEGGMAGVFILLAAYGWLVAVLEGVYMRAPPDRLTLAGAVVPLLAAFQIFVLRGDLQPAMGVFAPVIALVIICCGRLRRRSREVPQGGFPVPQRLATP